MKGIVLAGDSGSKLEPITLGIPKQLIPIYDKPMIFYPIETLVKAGINEILIITTSEYQSFFKKTIGNGKDLGVSVTYAIQECPNGIAQAISIGETFIGKDGFCLITGDTIIYGEGIYPNIKKAIRSANKSGNATIFIEGKTYPDQYGRVILNNEGKIQEIVGNDILNFYYSIASIFIFPNDAVKRVDGLNISERGRKEITDLHKFFFEDCKLLVRELDKDCIWFDTNTFDNLLKCSEFMSKKKK